MHRLGDCCRGFCQEYERDILFTVSYMAKEITIAGEYTGNGII